MKTNRYKFTAYEVSEMREAYCPNAPIDEPLPSELSNGLINAAYDRARLYITPCNWLVRIHDDGTATVTRYHN